MSTTVIASRLGALLTIAPFLGPSVDVERLRDVLAGHGLQLPDGEGLARSNEFIAAQGLEPEAAAVLARNLRRIGLHVRTVNDPTIRRSQRVGNASVVNVIAATGLVAGGAAGASAVLGAAAGGPPLAFLVALVLGVVMFLWSQQAW